jgi:hypothetical protein
MKTLKLKFAGSRGGTCRVFVTLALAFFVLTCGAQSEVRDVAQEAVDRIEEKIRPTDVRHESGVGYTARLSGGRRGDKDSAGSKCVLLEDGKALSTPRALHADIRDKGRGRYSHWTEGSLYFSASDNSDPRTNGKNYTLVSDARVLRHRSTVRVAGAENSYRIDALDGREVLNHKMTIRNLDERVAVSPRLALEGWPDLSSSEGILRSILKPEMTDEQKTLAIWKFLVDWRYHYYPAEGGAEIHDPVKFINVYGYGFCDDSAQNAAALAKMAGLKSRVWGLNGHVVAETFFEGRWHMIDPDHEVFYRASAGHIAGVEELAANPGIITREPRDPIGSDSGSIAKLYTTTANNQTYEKVFIPSHKLEPKLGPGDEVVFDLRSRDEFHAILFAKEGKPPTFANGRLTKRIAVGGGAQSAHIEWPYVMLGGRLSWRDDTGSVPNKVLMSVDGENYVGLPVVSNGASRSVDLRAWIKKQNKACYQFWLDASGPKAHVKLTLDFQFAPRALAQVQPGVNRFQCFVGTADGEPLPDSWKGLEVVHEWQESLEKKK